MDVYEILTQVGDIHIHSGNDKKNPNWMPNSKVMLPKKFK